MACSTCLVPDAANHNQDVRLGLKDVGAINRVLPFSPEYRCVEALKLEYGDRYLITSIVAFSIFTVNLWSKR